MVFLASTPKHRCQLAPGDQQPSQWRNLTEDQILELSIPWDSTREDYDSCSMYSQKDIEWEEGNYQDWVKLPRTTHKCTYGYHYDEEYYEKTIVTEVSDLI